MTTMYENIIVGSDVIYCPQRRLIALPNTQSVAQNPSPIARIKLN